MKQFILGVGAQKSGTTWLYYHLTSSSKYNKGFTKEYHHFDVLHLPQDRFRTTNFPDSDSYFDYFNRLWHSNSQTTTVGDITPYYSGLSSDVFEHIRDNLERRGFVIKVVFLMRDPVERIWSAARMIKRRDNSNKSVRELVLETYTTKPCELRTRYDITITNLERVFAKDQIFYSLYEELFTPYTLDRLYNFLEIDDIRLDSDTKINVTEKTESLDDECCRLVANHYTSVYKFIGDRYPIEGKWHSLIYL